MIDVAMMALTVAALLTLLASVTAIAIYAIRFLVITVTALARRSD